MAEAVIRIAAKAAQGYPIEFVQLASDDSVARTTAGVLPSGAIDPEAADTILLRAPSPAELETEGGALYDALHAQLGEPLQDFLDGPESVLYLNIAPAALQKVPWEVLHWPANAAGGVVRTNVAARHHPVRMYEPNWGKRSPAPDGPLRILVAIGAPQTDADVVPEEEATEVERALHPVLPSVDLRIERNYSRLYTTITEFRPHVLHFIGHGSADPPVLAFAGMAEAAAWDWSASEIRAKVGHSDLEKWIPNLAFLNACRTGAPAGELAAVAGAFLAAGTRATIAMQGNIQGRAAGLLAGTFYRKIAGGASIEQALSAARSVIAQPPFGIREALYPALSLRCRPVAVFPSFAKQNEYRAREPTCPYLAKLSVFVNQVTSRRKVYERLWPFRENGLRNNFVLIRGPAGFGKTDLSVCLLDLSASIGHYVRYVAVGRMPVDYVTVLDQIWGRKDVNRARSPLAQPLPLEPAADLDQVLANSKDPATMYSMFRRALVDLAKQRPVTIVLDEFGTKMNEENFWTLWENLFLALADTEMQDVNVILVLGEDECAQYNFDEKLRDHPEFDVPREEVALGEIPAKDFIDLFDLYLSYRDASFNSARRRKIRALLEDVDVNEFRPLSIDKLELKAKEFAGFMSVKLSAPRRTT